MATPDVLTQYQEDLKSLERFHSLTVSPLRFQRLRSFYNAWIDELAESDDLDLLLLRNTARRELARLEARELELAGIENLTPFLCEVVALDEARKNLEVVAPRQFGSRLSRVERLAREATVAIEGFSGPKYIAARASQASQELQKALKTFFEFFSGYDPAFTWWAAEPYRAADEALAEYVRVLREDVVGLVGDDDAVVGNPIGRKALEDDLTYELIPYSPEELIEIAEKEYAWCEREYRRAANELGFGDDWRAALEHVKSLHVEPGEQPRLVRHLAHEAVAFLEERDLVTVPELAKETWRMEMMSAERQFVNPFFLGGETIIVSFPTAEMSHERKEMSLRANNEHFARATVQHELIPGHHLQQFMNSRHNVWRKPLRTPFWLEGWALYWEMVLWDQGFPRGPEDRIGMLFWRSHRCVRIVFSLQFHLKELSAEECVQMLVDRVGHERSSAEGEVRRSLSGAYPPLYQAAYMLGGLQFRALKSEVVDSGRMSLKEFHDQILIENSMPVAALRSKLLGLSATDAFKPWRFYKPAD